MSETSETRKGAFFDGDGQKKNRQIWNTHNVFAEGALFAARALLFLANQHFELGVTVIALESKRSGEGM